jgi:hypothetical protein
MDKFEIAMDTLAKMLPDEKMKMIKEKKEMCICPGCPTYNDCAESAQETLFCVIGGSFLCISKEKDCICPICPVTPDLGLTRDFFCTRYSEGQQHWSAEHIKT